MSAAPRGPRRGSAAIGSAFTLDDLARSTAVELGAVYATGTVPELADLEGSPRGRMLAFAGPLGRGRAFEALRRFARARYFPWDGKSFASRSDGHGSGVNRVRWLGDLFRFDTRVAPSRLDGRPCVVLDYDLPDNPWFIRKIHDELRRVGPRLFLGPAMWKARRGERLVLYFAIAP